MWFDFIDEENTCAIKIWFGNKLQAIDVNRLLFCINVANNFEQELRSLSPFLIQRINWIFQRDIGIFYDSFFLRAGWNEFLHGHIFIFISERREKRSRSPPAGTLALLGNMSLVRENWSLGSSGLCIRRELSRTVHPGATLHKHALSRSTAYAYAIKSVGNAQVKADRDTFTDPNCARTCSHNEMCAYTPREIYR